MLSHEGIKKFACQLCDKSFCSQVALRTHLHRHTGEKPYKCSECDGSFRNAAQRNRHLKLHVNDLKLARGDDAVICLK